MASPLGFDRHAHLVPSQAFGPIHSPVSLLEQATDGIPISGIRCDPNTDRGIDSSLHVPYCYRSASHSRPDTLGNHAGLLSISFWQQNHELFSPKATKRVPATQDAPNPLSELA